MNGHILFRTNIAVDYWKIKGKQASYVHFLTHLHGDHIVGLTSSWKQTIYCSAVTAELLVKQYGISQDLVKVTPIDQAMIIKRPDNESFSVTAYDADHCPGSVMFFFEGNFGTILYTGDFRASNSVQAACKKLCGKVDRLYLDNTYCSPNCVFPTRQECLDKILKIVSEYPNHDIVIAVRKLGKEVLLAEIGVAMDETVYVSAEMLQVCREYLDTNVFESLNSMNISQARIRTVPLHKLSRGFLLKLNQERPTIAIIPTSLYTGIGSSPYCRDENVFVIPYSDHSSYPELIKFVSLIRPGIVIPIVNSKRGPFGTDLSARNNMSCFKPFLRDPPEKQPCNVVEGYASNSVLESKNHDAVSSELENRFNFENYKELSLADSQADFIEVSQQLRFTKKSRRKFRKVAEGVKFDECTDSEMDVEENPAKKRKRSEISEDVIPDSCDLMEYNERECAISSVTNSEKCSEIKTNSEQSLKSYFAPKEKSKVFRSKESRELTDCINSEHQNETKPDSIVGAVHSSAVSFSGTKCSYLLSPSKDNPKFNANSLSLPKSNTDIISLYVKDDFIKDCNILKHNPACTLPKPKASPKCVEKLVQPSIHSMLTKNSYSFVKLPMAGASTHKSKFASTPTGIDVIFSVFQNQIPMSYKMTREQKELPAKAKVKRKPVPGIRDRNKDWTEVLKRNLITYSNYRRTQVHTVSSSNQRRDSQKSSHSSKSISKFVSKLFKVKEQK